jgi:GrpB-like predicted nucleotidyltransferase (UPF0157 family)
MIDMGKIIERIREGLEVFVDAVFDAETKRDPYLSASTFPERMGEYLFEDELMKERTHRAYRLGLYRNDAGERAIAKRWVGSRCSLASHWLRNEISAYKILWDVIGSHPEIAERFPRVHIPRLIDTIERDDELVLLIEYIDGEALAESSGERKLAAYADALGFLAAISRLIGNTEFSPLSRRTAWHSLALLPVIFARAIMRHPRLTLFILRSVLAFLYRAPILLRDGTSGFSHRDLGDWNILVRGDDIWIIDFQLAAIAHPLSDVVGVSLKLWEKPDFGKTFLNSKYVSSLLTEKIAREEFHALSAHLAIYNLSLKSGRDPQTVMSFLSFRWRRSPSFLSYVNPRTLWKRLKQEMYILTYSSREKIRIEPFDPASSDVAQTVIAELRFVLPPNFIIHLLGSVSMCVAGQRDVDIFVECPTAEFRRHMDEISSFFGGPIRKKRKYVEWQFDREGWEVDVLLIDPTSEKFKDQLSVVWMLQRDKALRREYERIKWAYDGKSVREYERAKHAFFNRLRSSN